MRGAKILRIFAPIYAIFSDFDPAVISSLKAVHNLQPFSSPAHLGLAFIFVSA